MTIPLSIFRKNVIKDLSTTRENLKKLLKDEIMFYPHEYRIKLEESELKLIKKTNPKKILEVFCGDGKNLIYFAKKGYNIVGIESESEYLDKARKRLKQENLSENIIQHPVFMNPLSFEDNSFDVVYSYQYLNHNFKDQIIGVFREIFRVLKTGGLFSLKITIEQFNLKHLHGDIYKEVDEEHLQIRFRKLAPQTFAKLEGNEVWIPHYGFYNDELVECLEEIGFELINIRKIRWNLVGNFQKP